jgi:uncharacterized membrane protein
VLIGFGIAHLSFARLDYQAQVPSWVPLDADFVVVASGIVEIILGIGIASWGKFVPWAGLAAAAFFVAVFPGNISQYLNGIDALGFDSDGARLFRLFLQPVWIVWALWSTSALGLLRRKTKSEA